MSWTEIEDAELKKAALKLCRGSYQRAIVEGTQALSCSTLQGKAYSFCGKYKASSASLLERLRRSGIIVREKRSQPGNKRILVLGWPTMLKMLGYFGEV
jgi:hypothetical protein